MKGLTREQRRQLFLGQCPPITGEGPCPYEPGKVYDLSSKVTLKVLEVRRRRKGGWTLVYELRDRRDPPRLLRRTPGVQDFDAIRRGFDEYGYPPADDNAGDAAEESSYTGAPTSLADAGEAVHRIVQDGITKEARTRDDLRAEHRRERWELQQLEDRVRAIRLAGEASPTTDISRILAGIERRVVAAERKLRGRAA